MREKRVGLVGALGGATVGGPSSATCGSATGEVTASPGVSGLCFWVAAVGGIFVTCLMNVAMAR